MENIALCLAPTEGGFLSLLSRGQKVCNYPAANGAQVSAPVGTQSLVTNTSKHTGYKIISGAMPSFIISVSLFQSVLIL